jgi:tRNA threonylcarbamoyladenosine biosynthesis protein TsaE
MKFEIDSSSIYQTEAIATSIGSLLRGGEVIELSSELGGGKTTFTHGLASGIGSNDKVASPTFTISRIYNGKNIDIHHFDFYRLSDSGLMAHELVDVMKDPKNVVVVEWAELMNNVLPTDRLRIEFKYIDEKNRKLLFTCPESLSYLVGEYVNTSDSNR